MGQYQQSLAKSVLQDSTFSGLLNMTETVPKWQNDEAHAAIPCVLDGRGLVKDRPFGVEV